MLILYQEGVERGSQNTMQADILKRINDFASRYNVSVNDVKLKITRQIAQDFSRQEEDAAVTNKTVESAFEKVMKEVEKADKR